MPRMSINRVSDTVLQPAPLGGEGESVGASSQSDLGKKGRTSVHQRWALPAVLPKITEHSCPKCRGQRYTEIDPPSGVVAIICLNCGREEYPA